MNITSVVIMVIEINTFGNQLLSGPELPYRYDN